MHDSIVGRVIFFFLATVALRYLWVRLRSAVPTRLRWPGAILFVLLIFLAVAYRVLPLGLGLLGEATFTAGGFWLVTLSNWLVTCLVVDLFVLVVWINKRMMGIGGSWREIYQGLSRKRTSAIPVLAFLTVVVSIAFWVYGFKNQLAFQVTEQRVHVDKPLAKPLRIAVLSDLHFDPLFQINKLDRLVDSLEKVKPDMIVFLGDMSDLPSTSLDAMGIGDRLNRLHAPLGIYGITGNHEGYTLQRDPHLLDWIELHGVQLLRDESICLPLLCLTGREDPTVAKLTTGLRKTLPEILPNLADATQKPWLLLDHQPVGLKPEDLAGLTLHPDLGVSGHTHAGQFFPWTIAVKFAWPLAQNMGSLQGVPWYVTSGFGQWGPAVRVGCHTEILIIDLEGR